MADALKRVNNGYDKRPGSMLWNGNAPCLAELAQLYTALDFVFEATYILTAPREYLIKRASDRSIAPKSATPAIYSVILSTATGTPVPASTRFSAEELNFEVIAWPEDGELLRGVDVTDEETGESGTVLMQLIQCETAGTVGNASEGLQLIPIEYVPGLAPATVGALVTSAEDEEDTETFRARVIEAMRSIAFGGNAADYKEKILAIDGIGQCKVYPHWNDDIRPAELIPSADIEAELNSIYESSGPYPNAQAWLEAILPAAKNGKLTVGGTVRVVVMSSDTASPEVSDAGVSEIQTMLDPREAAGEGLGLAPIGHVVTVESVKPKAIDVVVSVTKQAGIENETVEAKVQEAIQALFQSLCEGWSSTVKKQITVYNAVVLYKIMEVCDQAIENLSALTLNGGTVDITLDKDEYPKLGTLTVDIT